MSSLDSIIGGFNQNNLCSHLDDWVSILEHYNYEVTEDEVWEIARCYETFPLIENIYQICVINHLETIFIEQVGCDRDDVKFDSYVNCCDTHFSIDEEVIYNADDFSRKVIEAKAQLY